VVESASVVLGTAATDFEKQFKREHNVHHYFVVSPGTDGNHMALVRFDIGPGNEVIIPADTFVAAAQGPKLRGAATAFTDCNSQNSVRSIPSSLRGSCANGLRDAFYAIVIIVHCYNIQIAALKIKPFFLDPPPCPPDALATPGPTGNALGYPAGSTPKILGTQYPPVEIETVKGRSFSLYVSAPL